jgi:DnaJ like chaperone protein
MRRPIIKRKSAAGGPRAQALALLGLPRGASSQEIQDRYREIVRELHPDVLAQKGIPADLRTAAEEMLRSVNAARQVLRRSP